MLALRHWTHGAHRRFAEPTAVAKKRCGAVRGRHGEDKLHRKVVGLAAVTACSWYHYFVGLWQCLEYEHESGIGSQNNHDVRITPVFLQMRLSRNHPRSLLLIGVIC